jgi:hypothetical protein
MKEKSDYNKPKPISGFSAPVLVRLNPENMQIYRIYTKHFIAGVVEFFSYLINSSRLKQKRNLN